MEKEIDGEKFEIRPLTRGEVKSLRKKGYNRCTPSVIGAMNT